MQSVKMKCFNWLTPLSAEKLWVKSLQNKFMCKVNTGKKHDEISQFILLIKVITNWQKLEYNCEMKEEVNRGHFVFPLSCYFLLCCKQAKPIMHIPTRGLCHLHLNKCHLWEFPIKKNKQNKKQMLSIYFFFLL